MIHILQIRKSHLMRVTTKGTLANPLLFCTKFRPVSTIPVLFSRSCVSSHPHSKMLRVATRSFQQHHVESQSSSLAILHQRPKSLSARIDPSVLCICTDSRQRNGWEWFTDFWSLFRQFRLQLREDVEVILQYGIHPTRSCRKITLSIKHIPIFALQYTARGNHLLENYNELEERRHRIHKRKYKATKN